MGGDSSISGRVVDGALTGGFIGLGAGTMTSFWNSAGVSVNRAKVAQQVVPTIAANVGYLAGEYVCVYVCVCVCVCVCVREEGK